MLTSTTELAIRALLVLGLEQSRDPMTPRALAERLDCSPSYLGKTLGLLTKSGLLQSVRGARGGVILLRAPEDVTLLDIVEACQGLVTADYCRGSERPSHVCGYHVAMKELHDATIRTLSGWTLAALLRCPARPSGGAEEACKMQFGACEQHWPAREESS
ncbi:MAG: Rrf2 family transcriptional regulator [Deltaproteobacteria bacterium]|nr:MAG: Rrf2 family transcriptional regulator [Deltaproteobacteria bacterium]